MSDNPDGNADEQGGEYLRSVIIRQGYDYAIDLLTKTREAVSNEDEFIAHMESLSDEQVMTLRVNMRLLANLGQGATILGMACDMLLRDRGIEMKQEGGYNTVEAAKASLAEKGKLDSLTYISPDA